MHRVATLILALAPILASCGPGGTSGVAGTESAPALASPELGLQLTELPEGVRPSGFEGDGMALDAISDGVSGRLVITAGLPVPAGINLVDEANAFGQAAEAAGGEYFGGQQIVTPWSSGFVVRVREAGGSSEELRAFLLHPGDRDRLLTLSLRYPQGEPEVSRDRFAQLVAILETLERLETDASPAD